MQIRTRRFGVIDADDSQILTFPEGLIGFPEYTMYVAVSLDGSGVGLGVLQSVEEPELGFITLDPKWAFGGYDPEFGQLDLLDLGEPEDLVLRVVVTVPSNMGDMTANLQAPLVMNPKKRVGKQVILASPEYTTRHRVFRDSKNRSTRTG